MKAEARGQRPAVRGQKEHLTPALSLERRGSAARVTHCEKAPDGVLLYTKTQMAGLLQVSMRCLNEMMANGQISYLKIGGKLVRFRASHVLRRLKETSFVCRGLADLNHEAHETHETNLNH